MRLPDKLSGALSDLSLCLRLRSREAVAGTGNRDEFVLNPGLRQLAGHVLGFGVRHVRVFRPVNQERRRILRRDMADRAIPVEPLGLGVWVVSRHFVGPNALLTTIEIEPPTLARGRRFAKDAVAHATIRLFLGNQRFPAVERVGFGVPRRRDVAVAVVETKAHGRGVRQNPVIKVR